MSRSVKILWAASGVMALAFGVFCLLDWFRYGLHNSAPYWAFVAARAIEFLIPAAIFALAALIVQYHQHHRKK